MDRILEKEKEDDVYTSENVLNFFIAVNKQNYYDTYSRDSRQ